MGINNNEALENTATLVDLDFCLVAMPYTLLDQASLHPGMATCQKRGVSVIIGAPFASGILVTGSSGPAHYAYGKASPEIQAKVRGIEAVCAAHKVALPAAALQFVLAHPIVASVIPGAAKPEEVVQNVASLQAAIPAAFWSDLKSQGLIDRRGAGPGRQLSMANYGHDAHAADFRPWHLQDLRHGRGAARCRSRPDAGRNSCAAGRERRRQVDLRQDPRRRAPPDARHARR